MYSLFSSSSLLRASALLVIDLLIIIEIDLVPSFLALAESFELGRIPSAYFKIFIGSGLGASQQAAGLIS